MAITEVVEALVSGFSDLLESLKEWAVSVLENFRNLLDATEPNKKALITLDRPLMGLKYPETFKYLKNQQVVGDTYG